MPRRFWAAVSLSAGSMLYALDANLANVALPVISAALQIDQSTAVLIVSVYNLVLAMALLPLAAAGEHFGHRRIFAIGLVGYSGAAILCLFADGLLTLVVFRAFQALASAAILSVSLAMVRLTYPGRMLGRGLGLNTMMAALGAALAPPLSGLVMAFTSWQPVFVIGLPLAVAALSSARALPDFEGRVGRFDGVGAVLCAITFGLLVSSLQAMGQGASGLIVAAGLTGGTLAAVVFVRHAKGTRLPVLPIDLLAQPALSLSVASGLLAVLSMTLIMLYLPFRLHELGFGSATIGAMLAPYAIAVMIAAPASGMLSDRIAPAILGTGGMVLAVAGVVSLALLSETTSFSDVAWRTALCGVGFSVFFAPNGRLVVGSVARDRAAGASSMLATTRMFGQAVGATALAGLLTLQFRIPAPGLAAIILAVLACLGSAARIIVKPAQAAASASADRA